MPRPELLVLDIGGVLFPSSMPRLLRSMSEVSPRSERNLKRFFNHRLRDDLWSGRMDLATFWERLLDFAELPPDTEPWRARMAEILSPMPAVDRVASWARRVPLGILSNHRHEWVTPALEACGVLGHFDRERVLISSETGLVKPYPEAFRPLLDLGLPADRVLLVDDRYNNVTAAHKVGVQVLMADEDHAWLDRLDAELG